MPGGFLGGGHESQGVSLDQCSKDFKRSLRKKPRVLIIVLKHV